MNRLRVALRVLQGKPVMYRITMEYDGWITMEDPFKLIECRIRHIGGPTVTRQEPYLLLHDPDDIMVPVRYTAAWNRLSPLRGYKRLECDD